MSALSSVRVIVFKILDLLSTKDVASINWTTGKQMLHEVVHALRDAFDVLTNTTFWLSIGRQLEPHQFDLIFPLPSKPKERFAMSTAEDLFCISCEHGSLSTALSALPLFSCHMTSQKRVVQLVYHCLDSIMRGFETASHVSVEEAKFIHQLFWFGVKLEDAIESLDASSSFQASCDESIAGSSTETSVSSSSSSSSSDTETDCSSTDSKENSVLPRQTTQNGMAKTGIISKVVTNLFPSKKHANGHVDEDAIHDAASNFIVSCFESPLKSRLTTPLPVRQDIARSMRTHDHNESAKRKLSFDEPDKPHDPLEYSDVTVAGAVSTFISSTVGLNKDPTKSSGGWKVLSLVAHLLQGDRETAAITSTASTNAQNISRASTIHVDNLTNDESNDNDVIIQFLEQMIGECSSQIHPEAAGTIFNLILLLLLRYETCEDVHASKTTLITVGIVVGHISGRIAELIDFSVDNPIRAFVERLES